jgi:hypothetical protein
MEQIISSYDLIKAVNEIEITWQINRIAAQLIL